MSADDDLFLPSPVPSPCINICRMSPATGLCEGCWRTIDEITVWSRLDDEAKRAVWRHLQHRKSQAKAA